MRDLILFLGVLLAFSIFGFIGHTLEPKNKKGKRKQKGSTIFSLPDHTQSTAISGRNYFLGEPDVEDVWLKQEKNKTFTLFIKYKKTSI